MKGLFTPLTAPSIVFEFIEFSMLTTGTKSVSIFEAFFRQVFSGSIFTGNQLTISL